MEEKDKRTNCDKNILIQQLSELNSRSRWYTSRLWQVPFAYLGLTGLVLVNLADKSALGLSLGFIVSAIFGVLVLVHIYGVRDGEKRAVKNLQDIESLLPCLDRLRTSHGMKHLYG